MGKDTLAQGDKSGRRSVLYAGGGKGQGMGTGLNTHDRSPTNESCKKALPDTVRGELGTVRGEPVEPRHRRVGRQSRLRRPLET